ncbi:conserved hypothetical protein [Thermotomaculum hydrothermale]|uniref:Histidine kinase N-terminal 7TM region domain-containing protein n=1 Tax=Thermotomaculum hydrothermale TaxID=981385 RepID=A0A7R6SY16_9BACT|nr:hypothetical protein [Thermotomaculum hydrothermale]BBB32294.1 conserved hypothetical protein [Thermotomaculum hydrothermale]
MGSTQYTGLLVNAAVSFIVFISSWFLAIKVIKKKAYGKARIPALAFSVVWLDIGLIYLSVAIRTIAAYFGLEQMDKMFFYADNFFGAMLAGTIIFFTTYFLFKNKKVADSLAIIWVIAGFIWFYFDVKIGAQRVGVSYWLSEWKPGSEMLMIAFGAMFYVPGLIALILLLLTSKKASSRTSKYKIVMTALSLFIGATLMMIDLAGTKNPIAGLFVRVLIAFVTILGHLAYFPTKKIEEWLERG